MRRRAFLAGVVAFGAAPSLAKSKIAALSGARFSMDGKEYHLADILAPNPHALGADAEPYFAAARAAFQTMLRDGEIAIDRAIDKTRWGAAIVDARRAGDARTLQERVIEAGAARVAPQTDNLELIDRLLEAERAARDASRGLWRERAYRVFDAASARGAIGGFHLVEGQVRRAAMARDRFYLNFGDDFRTDFTASARRAIYRRWRDDGFDLEQLDGAHVRIRGYVRDINGPSIELEHKRQVETLAPSS